MIDHALITITLYATTIVLGAPVLGYYIAKVYTDPDSQGIWRRIGRTCERVVYRLTTVDPTQEMTWRQYATAVLILSLISFCAVYGLQRCQGHLPLNPMHHTAVAPDLAFNTAVSFVTNTNWQAYGGEATMSHLTQMLALTVQNFISAAVGLAVMAAFLRGFTRASTPTIGNFWVDVTRAIVYVLLPLSAILAVALVSQGVVQTLQGQGLATLVEPTVDINGAVVTTQPIAIGPVASQVAIKQLGTNGGGFFNTNSAHPLENPTPISNFLQMVAILLIPAALCFTFGEMVHDRRQGWAIFGAMCLIFVPLVLFVIAVEQQGHHHLAAANVDLRASQSQPGGNMEGKETRFGIVDSAIWSVATTAASNGSVNSMHDSFTPLGGLIAMWLMQLGEVVFGGVGSGLYGMLLFAILAVFIAGLMVGRTPEYLGKKIGAFEIKMATLAILIPCAMVLVGTALALGTSVGRAAILNPGPHGFSEVLYAFSSASNNNGSAFAGLSANSSFYNGMLGLAMLIGRFWVMLPVLAIAGSLAHKKAIPTGPGTLPTHTPLFITLLVAVIIVVGALSFFPALALGPIAEHLLLNSTR